MCEELHDPFEDQVACARYRAERDALAQRMEEVASEIDRTLSGVEGIEDAPAMRWMRGLREALGSLHAPRIGCEGIEAARWVREHGGLEHLKNSLSALELFAEGIEIDTGLAFSDESPKERCIALRNEVKSRLMPEGMEEIIKLYPRYEDGTPALPGMEAVANSGSKSGEAFTIRKAWLENGTWHLSDHVADGHYWHWKHKDRVVKRPETDSWQRLEEDAGRNPFDYCKEVGHRLDTCENSEAYKALDIVRRAKALAGVSE